MLVFKWILMILLLPIVAFGLFLFYSSITNYSPKEQEIQVESETAVQISDTISLSLLSWNIGYAGLDKSMDFFYDGGEKVRPTKEASIRNLNGISKILKKYKNYDFLLLQELDVKSKRSYRINQVNTIQQLFKGHTHTMGINYKVKYVPVPLSDPLGAVHSGVVTYSKFESLKTVRHSFPGNYSWPMSLFMLDRCFLVNEYPLENGKNLVVINTHNSAYDDGSLRQQQMDYLKSILIDLYKKGNYVIVGGDWNQCPNGFEPDFSDDVFNTDDLLYIEPNYPEQGWSYAYDQSIPTNRQVLTPYEKGKTLVTVIDFFLLSPNIEVEKVNGRDLGFEFSDHQPVELKIKLIK